MKGMLVSYGSYMGKQVEAEVPKLQSRVLNCNLERDCKLGNSPLQSFTFSRARPKILYMLLVMSKIQNVFRVHTYFLISLPFGCGAIFHPFSGFGEENGRKVKKRVLRKNILYAFSPLSPIISTTTSTSKPTGAVTSLSSRTT
jgi:hypothetical protein